MVSSDGDLAPQTRPDPGLSGEAEGCVPAVHSRSAVDHARGVRGEPKVSFTHSLPFKADVRLIAATNRDLTVEMAVGRFRSDLFYRLGVFNVHLPPLRERGDDVLILADAFIRTLAPKMGKTDVTLSRDACKLLRRHPWPGNIRELQNAIERALITCEGTLVTAAHLAIPLPPEPICPTGPPEPLRPATSLALDELARKAIIDALQRTHGHKARAAELLGLTRFQLYNRLNRYHIEVSPE